MRRVALLINDIKFNSNNSDDNRYTNVRLMKLFNDAQRAIQMIIHNNNPTGSFFPNDVFVDLVSNQESYDLPSDIYSHNSVNSIARSGTNSFSNYYQPMRQLTEKERRKAFGYILQGKTFMVSPLPVNNLSSGVRVNYERKLPTLSSRVGKISAATPTASIQLDAGFSTEQITDFEDHFCIVDRNGNILDQEFNLNGYNPATGLITTDATLVNGAVGDYVVLGRVSSSHSELPDNAETLLTDFVERKIYGIDSSSDVANMGVFTEEEKIEIIELYKEVSRDVKYPPITSDEYLNF